MARKRTLKDDLDTLIEMPSLLGRTRRTTATSESSPLEIGWVELPAEMPAGARLGITFAPGKRGPAVLSDTTHERTLSTDLKRLKDHHRADILCDCTEFMERDDLGIAALPDAAAAHGITYMPLPIMDVCAPRGESATQQAIYAATHLAAALHAGQTVVVNCRGGRGRSGMIAACVLIALGTYPPRALEAVRAARPGAVETYEQEGFLWQAALRFLGLGWGNPGWATVVRP